MCFDRKEESISLVFDDQQKKLLLERFPLPSSHRHINNMYNGIYLNYLLSYPVKYSKEVREKIRESFERGIRKSIPFAVLNDEECAKKFKVELRASEPAAYAISALKEYGFYDEDYVEYAVDNGYQAEILLAASFLLNIS